MSCAVAMLPAFPCRLQCRSRAALGPIRRGPARPARAQAYVGAFISLTGGESIDGTVIVEVEARLWTEATRFGVPDETIATKSPMSSDPGSGRRSTDSPTEDRTALGPCRKAISSAGLVEISSHERGCA